MIEDEFRALIMSPTGRGVYRLGEKIEDYEINEITAEQVILSNGVQTVTLKRGDSK